MFGLLKTILKIFIGIVIALALYHVVPVIISVVSMVVYTGMEEAKYDNSFYITYNIKEYDDPRINFYAKELEKNYNALVYAKSNTELFKSYTKIELATQCVEYYLKNDGEDNWIKVSRNIERNARNKVLHKDKNLIDLTKKNLHNVWNNFYVFELDTVRDLADNITNSWRYPSKHSRCDDNLTTEQMYDIFLPKYVKGYTILN